MLVKNNFFNKFFNYVNKYDDETQIFLKEKQFALKLVLFQLEKDIKNTKKQLNKIRHDFIKRAEFQSELKKLQYSYRHHFLVYCFSKKIPYPLIERNYKRNISWTYLRKIAAIYDLFVFLDGRHFSS